MLTGHFGAKGVNRHVLLAWNHKTKYAVLFRLLIQTIEAPKKRKRTVRVTNTVKKKVEKDDSK